METTEATQTVESSTLDRHALCQVKENKEAAPQLISTGGALGEDYREEGAG